MHQIQSVVDLNLKNKGIVLNVDSIGIYNQINQLLAVEGATTILNDNQDTYDRICYEGIKICSLVNVVEGNYRKGYEGFLQSLFQADLLTSDFTMINICLQGSIRDNDDFCMEDMLDVDHILKSLELSFCSKNISIILPEYKKNINKKVFLTEVGKIVAESIAFIVSEKSNLNNGQIIFIDKGAHLNDKFYNSYLCCN